MINISASACAPSSITRVESHESCASNICVITRSEMRRLRSRGDMQTSLCVFQSATWHLQHHSNISQQRLSKQHRKQAQATTQTASTSSQHKHSSSAPFEYQSAAPVQETPQAGTNNNASSQHKQPAQAANTSKALQNSNMVPAKACGVKGETGYDGISHSLLQYETA